MFTEQLPDLLDYINNLPGFVCHVCDMNIHFVDPLQSLAIQTLTSLSLYNLVQVINKPTHRCGHIIDWVVVRPDDDIHKKSTVADSLESDHYCIKSYFNVSVSKPYTGRLGTWLTLTVHHLLLNFPVYQSFHLLKKANQYSEFLRTVLDKHAPPSLQKVITHNSSPWFESIIDELFIAKRERRQV